MRTEAQTRAQVRDAKRIVVKVGSSSLSTVQDGLDRDRVRRIARVLGEQRAAGREIVLVSSGAVAAGLEPMGITRRPRDQATKQAAAGVGQSLLMAEYTHTLAEHGIVPAQVLLTADDLIHRAKYRNAQRAVERMLALWIFPIVIENDAVVSHGVRFGDGVGCARHHHDAAAPRLVHVSGPAVRLGRGVQRDVSEPDARIRERQLGGLQREAGKEKISVYSL